MIDIRSERNNITNIKGILNSLDEQELLIDMEHLDLTIEKYKKLGHYSKYDKKNINNIIKWMVKIKEKTTEDNILKYVWKLNGTENRNKLTSYPVDMTHITEYDIGITDFISTKPNQKVIKIEFKDLNNLMALAIAHRDLSYSIERIESLLADMGIISHYPIDDLRGKVKHFDELYNTAIQLKINDSQYTILKKKKTFTDYFFMNEIATEGYREPINQSSRHLVLIVATDILEELLKQRHKASLIELRQDGFYIMVEDMDTDKIKRAINKIVTVQLFYRRFELKPTVTIY